MAIFTVSFTLEVDAHNLGVAVEDCSKIAAKMEAREYKFSKVKDDEGIHPLDVTITRDTE